MERKRKFSGTMATDLLVLVLFTSALVCASPALAQSSEEIQPNPEAEAWILEQVAAGQVADLEERFPDEAQRVVGVDFLERLLSGALVEAPRQGVQIEGAIFVEPVDLESIEVPFEVRLVNCQFKEEVNLTKSRFERGLSFWGSSFLTDAKFYAMRVGQNACFSWAIFDGHADFGYAEIGGSFLVDDVKFNDAEEVAYFNTMTVGVTAFFNRAVFEGPVDFKSAEIGLNLYADGAKFNSAEKEVDFNSIKVNESVSFNLAEFNGPVDFGYAMIGYLDMDDAKFNNPEQRANFGSVKVGDGAFFNRAEFYGPVDFGHAMMGTDLDMDDAKFNGFGQSVYFDRMKIGGSALFYRAIFEGPVNFVLADTGVNFEADDARFNNPEGQVDFNSMKVGVSAFFNRAVFEGPVDFGYADIGGSFDADDAKFNNTEEEANFYAMKVGVSARFNRAAFEGPLNFGYADVGWNFVANDAEFNSNEGEASFNRMKVGNSTSFEKAVFEGYADFRYAEVILNFYANEVKFNNPEQEADFNSMKVGNTAFFDQSVFEGPVDFQGATIGDRFWADRARFANQADYVSFTGMQVGDSMYLDGAIFAGPVAFDRLQVGVDLSLDGSEFTNPSQTVSLNRIAVDGVTFLRGVQATAGVEMKDGLLLDLVVTGPDDDLPFPGLDLRRTQVERELRIEDLVLQRLTASALVVGGPATLAQLTVTGTLDLEASSFQALTFEDFTPPEEAASFILDGISYQSISTGEEITPETWVDLLAIAEAASYSPQVYRSLEQFLESRGHPDLADKVYIAQRRRERREVYPWYSPSWWGNLLLDVFVLYGRGAWLAGLWCLGFIAAGGLVFRNAHQMEFDREASGGRIARHYNPIWYSLDLFIPYIDLQFARYWAPKEDRKGALVYMRAHRLVGFLLILIAILSLTGLIK